MPLFYVGYRSIMKSGRRRKAKCDTIGCTGGKTDGERKIERERGRGRGRIYVT